MKKVIISILLVVSIICSMAFLFACQKEKENTIESVSIVVPDGAPALGIASLIKNKKIGDISVDAKVVVADIIGQEAARSDFAVIPVNAAAKLYNKGSDLKVVTTVTNGNLFFLSSVDKQGFTVEDLKGKMLYSIGKNLVPSAMLMSLLNAKGINYEEGETAKEGVVTIKYLKDGPTLLPYLVNAKKNGEEVYGFLAEPAVSTAVGGGKAYKVADFQELYKEATNSEEIGFAQAVLVCKSTMPQVVVEAMIKALQDNVAYIETSPSEAVEAIASIYETTLKANIPLSAVKGCNIRVENLRSSYSYIDKSLKAMFAVNNDLVGAVPAIDSEFYY